MRLKVLRPEELRWFLPLIEKNRQADFLAFSEQLVAAAQAEAASYANGFIPATPLPGFGLGALDGERPVGLALADCKDDTARLRLLTANPRIHGAAELLLTGLPLRAAAMGFSRTDCLLKVPGEQQEQTMALLTDCGFCDVQTDTLVYTLATDRITLDQRAVPAAVDGQIVLLAQLSMEMQARYLAQQDAAEMLAELGPSIPPLCLAYCVDGQIKGLMFTSEEDGRITLSLCFWPPERAAAGAMLVQYAVRCRDCGLRQMDIYVRRSFGQQAVTQLFKTKVLQCTAEIMGSYRK